MNRAAALDVEKSKEVDEGGCAEVMLEHFVLFFVEMVSCKSDVL